MFSQMASFFAIFRMPLTDEIEREYMNRSVSMADVERRQREIDSGLFRRDRFAVRHG